MPRPSVSTGRGDDGTTDLFRGGRTHKSALRIHALGTIDELNAILGLALAEPDFPESLRSPMEQVQRALFLAGSDIATITPKSLAADIPLHPQGERLGEGSHRLSAMHIEELEKWGIEMEQELPKLTRFILPGGSKASALLHQARAVCRRAERWVVGLANEEGVNPEVRVYLNRLSDDLFLAARMANKDRGSPDVLV
ncbi:MAG: cob(I)yrinic acid a,c-diamide adenosyltransferase [Candidatus Peregrinibacteria bacterium]